MSRKQTPRELLFVFRPSSSCQHGCLRTIYSDDVLELIRQGEARISRASHVEPDDSGQWTADLSPVGGPILGHTTCGRPRSRQKLPGSRRTTYDTPPSSPYGQEGAFLVWRCHREIPEGDYIQKRRG